MPKYEFTYTMTYKGSIIVAADSRDDAFENLDKGISDGSIDLEAFIDHWGEEDFTYETLYEGDKEPDYNWETPEPVFQPLQTESLFKLIDTNA